MKKRMLAMLLPFCCLTIAPAFAQESQDEVTTPEVAVVTSDDEASDVSTPPSLFKKGCGCKGNGK